MNYFLCCVLSSHWDELWWSQNYIIGFPKIAVKMENYVLNIETEYSLVKRKFLNLKSSVIAKFNNWISWLSCIEGKSLLSKKKAFIILFYHMIVLLLLISSVNLHSTWVSNITSGNYFYFITWLHGEESWDQIVLHLIHVLPTKKSRIQFYFL